MTLLLLALAPALGVLVWYYYRDRHPEPWPWVTLVFFLGAVSCAVAYPLEKLMQGLVPSDDASPGRLLLECLLIPGLIEESVKLAVVAVAVLWRPDFDDPVDGLIYATAAALGFTYGEDLTYYLREGADWTRVWSTAAHPWFSCFWGTALGWSRVLPRGRGVVLVLLGLIASIAVHAAFDFLVLTADTAPGWRWLLPPLLIGLYLCMEWQIERAQPAVAQTGVTFEPPC